MKTTYEDISSVNVLIGQTYMLAAILGLIALGVAVLIASSINYQGGKNENSHVKRRIWFIVIGLFFAISFFIYNLSVIIPKIAKPSLIEGFSRANIVATLLLLGIYIIVGVLTMMVFRKSKWGSILHFGK